MLKNLAWLGGLVILPLAVFALLTTLPLTAQAQENGPRVTASPTTVLPNQRISLTGTGFTPNSRITYISISGQVEDGTGINQGIPHADINDGEPVTVDNGGKWSALVNLPLVAVTTWYGSREIQVSDSGGSNGTVNVTIPKRVVFIDPPSSRLGSTVVVRGDNFPSKNDNGVSFNIEIAYDNGSGRPATVSTVSDASGRFEAEIRISTDSSIPSTNTVRVSFDDANDVPVTTTATHEVPFPTVTASPNSGVPGSVITLRGEGFKPFAPVWHLYFGGVDIMPAPAPATNAQGITEFDIIVPGLDSGRHTISVQVSDVGVGAQFTVTSPSTPTPTPTITLSANSGERGSTVTLRVEGAKTFVPVQRVMVGYVEVTPQPAPATNAQGVVEFDITIPGLDAGRHTIEVQVSGVTVSAGFTVIDPPHTITLSQTSGAPGETITLRGEGFNSYVPVQSAWIGDIGVLPSPAPSTDAQGRTEFEILIPGLDPGRYLIYVRVSGSSVAAVLFTVTAASAPTPTPRPTATPTPTPAPATEPPQLPGSSEPPHIFAGQAILNGSPAGQGVAIDAYDGGRLIGATVTQAGGRFSIHVHRAEGVITFRVNNQAAAESWTAWQRGQVTTGFDLTAGGDGSRETDPARLFAALPDLVRAFGFDNATKQWDFFDPAAADVSTLTRFMPGNIYWLLVSRTTSLVLNGMERDLFCVEDDCWNLIVW